MVESAPRLLLQPHPDLPHLLHYTALSPHVPALTAWLSSISLPSLTSDHPTLAVPPLA